MGHGTFRQTLFLEALEERRLLAVTLEDQNFYGGSGDQRGTDIDVQGAGLYVVGTDQSTSNGLVLGYGTPPAGPTWNTVLAGNTYLEGLTVTADTIYTVGGALPPACGAVDGVGGTEHKSAMARYSLAGALVGCGSANFFSYTGGEGYQSTLAVDEGGSTFVYATGSAQANGANNTAILAKHGSDGSLVWSQVLGSTGAGQGSAGSSIAQLNDNIYVAGGQDQNLRLWKYDSAGAQQWAVGLANFVGTTSVTTLGGHLYVAGAISNGPNGGSDVQLLKYDEAGNLVWSQSWGGAADELSHDIAHNGDRLFVVGETSSFGAGGRDAFLLEVDPVDGAVLTTEFFGGAQDDKANGVVVDGADIYVVGEARSFAQGGNAVGENDVMLLHYSLPSLAVTTVSDGGNGSLRQAIIDANAIPSHDTITLPSGHYTLSIAGAGGAATGDLNITDDLTIVGAGAGTTIIDATGLGDRVFDVSSGVSFEISGVTITGGSIDSPTSSENGGGIRNAGTLTVRNSVITGNTGSGGTLAGGGASGGGIFNTGTALIVDSTVSDNHLLAAGGGGGVMNSGSTAVLTVVRSTFSNNVVDASAGGAIYNNGGTLSVINSTFSANTAGALRTDYGGGIFNDGTASVTNSTLTLNSGSAGGGGIHNHSGRTLNLRNTIVSGNTGGGNVSDLGTLRDLGGNLIGGDPRLGPLQDNGGATWTHALLPGSPAIDAGTDVGAPGFDQRGVARPQAAAVDTGAFELDVVNQPPTAVANGPYSIGVGYSLVLDASGSFDPDEGEGDSIVSYQWDLDNDGVFDDAAGANPTVPWPTLYALGISQPADPNTGNPTYPIALRVTDTWGATSAESDTSGITDTTTLTIYRVDYGDAPDPTYPTLLSSNGARHFLSSPLFLGASVDSDPNGQPTTDAEGDDTDGHNDDNGVTEDGPVVAGQTTGFTVTVTDPEGIGGFLDAWIDLNQDGDWNDDGEHFLTSQPVVHGPNPLNVLVPESATPGDTYVRFRLSSAGGLAPTGLATDGEVEDYEVTVLTNVQIIDNGDSRFNTVGSWTGASGQGYGNYVDFSAPGTGQDVASWTFDVLPGQYRVSATWSPHVNRATNARYTVLNGSSFVGQTNVNQEQAPDDLNDQGASWENLGVFDILGSTLTVTLDDQANEYVIADAVRIERVGDVETGPEIELRDGTTNIADGGTVNFGTTPTNAAVDKVLTVRNVGTANLTLTPLNPGNLPVGFSLVSNFGSTTLAPGSSTTFTVRLQSASEGTFSGPTSFANNDTDEAPFNLFFQGTVADTPPSTAIQIIDNADSGFTAVGNWTHGVGAGFQNDIHYSNTGSLSDVARWTFQVAPGEYRVAATWPPHANRATNSRYRMYDGTNLVGELAVNQEQVPDGFSDAGALWKDLGTVAILGTTVKVELDAQADEYVIADAVRIERVGDVQTGSEIELLDGATDIPDGGTVNFGTTPANVALDKVLTVRNVGTENLTLTPLNAGNLPVGFSLVSNFGSTTLTPGSSTTFTVRLQSASEGTYSGPTSFANNDTDEATFDLFLQGTVTEALPPPAIQIIDDADSGFTAVGTWTHGVGAGFQNDIHYSNTGSASDVARWTFNVTPGQYRVSATWPAHANRATNSPYTIYDGTNLVGALDVNQEQAPNDFSDAGALWEDLGTVAILGTTVKVELDAEADQYVIADAIRIERLGDAVTGPEIELRDGTTNIADGGTVNFGTTTANVAVDKVLTVRNVGTENLTLTPLNAGNLPAGYSLVSNFGSTTVTPGSSTTFTVRLQSASEGTFSGSTSFANNDTDEAPFDLFFQGTVTEAPPPAAIQIIDNGDVGFSRIGNWTLASDQGFQNDVDFSPSGNGGNIARWTFNVNPGEYRVSATWREHANRATDSPFTIFDGANPVAQVDVNQELAPNDFAIANAWWEDLANVMVSGNTLTVELSDNANEYVIADAIRINMLFDPTRLLGPAGDLANNRIPVIGVAAPSAGDSAVDDRTNGTGLPTSRTRILVTFTNTATVSQANSAIQSVSGTIIGAIPEIDTLLISIPDTGDFNGLDAALSTLRNDPAVALAIQDIEMGTASTSQPSTPVIGTWTWNVPPSADGNWGLEETRVPQLWNLNDYGEQQNTHPVTSVFDVGFNDANNDGTNEHPDLNGLQTWVFDPIGNQFIPGSVQHVHGQQVAGVVGARFDNGTGIDGVNPFAEQHAARDGHFLGISPRTTYQSDILHDLLAMLEHWTGIDVVNISLGFNWYQFTSGGLDLNSDPEVMETAESYGLQIRAITNQYPDTVFVTAAGNDSAATTSGPPFTKEVLAMLGSGFNYAALGPESSRPGLGSIFTTTPNNIIVVESVDAITEGGKFLKSDFSNVGGNVSAPGGNIVTTGLTDYGPAFGTSFAAPHVTGLIGYLLTLDPSLDVPQLRQLITGDAYTRQTVPSPTDASRLPAGVTATAPMMDAFSAAMGIDLIRGNRTVQKKLVDVDDGSLLDGNARQDRDDENANHDTDETYPFGIRHADGYRGDGVIDMKDFRVFRDAMLQVLMAEGYLSTANVSLDGSSTDLKKDLNFDGEVSPGSTGNFPAETIFPRYDFNGSGKIEPEGRLVNPGPNGVAPFKVDPDGICANLDLGAGCLRDIDVLADPAIWSSGEVSAVELANSDLNGDGVIDYLYSGDLHFIAETDPSSTGNITVTVDSMNGAAVAWTKTFTIPSPAAAPKKRLITVPLFGSRDVNVTVTRNGMTDAKTYNMKYGQDEVIKLNDESVIGTWVGPYSWTVSGLGCSTNSSGTLTMTITDDSFGILTGSASMSEVVIFNTPGCTVDTVSSNSDYFTGSVTSGAIGAHVSASAHFPTYAGTLYTSWEVDVNGDTMTGTLGSTGTLTLHKQGALRVTSAPTTDQTAPALTQTQVESIVDQAVAEWAGAGLEPEGIDALSQLRFEVTDLPDTYLGLATPDVIYIDLDAAGHGWFVDPTPARNEEFVRDPSDSLRADELSPAAGRIDLLTVLTHEMGHVLGLDDLDSHDHPDDIMVGALEPGVRRLPRTATVDFQTN